MNKKDFNKNKLIETAYKILDGKIIGNIVLPVILVVFGFCKIGRGIEFADTGYNYGNFVYLSSLDNMWFCSTFLSCVAGRLFTFLPFTSQILTSYDLLPAYYKQKSEYILLYSLNI